MWIADEGTENGSGATSAIAMVQAGGDDGLAGVLTQVIEKGHEMCLGVE